jgi:hypothetical protein
MKKKRSVIKKRAWGWFSKYIRARDCLATTGDINRGVCVTCGEEFPFNKLQAGHCLGGRNDTILFDEELVNAQCENCNRSAMYGGLDGNYGEYHIWFVEKYGMESFKEKVFISKQDGKISTPELEEISDKYRIKYNELKNNEEIGNLP